MNNSIAQKYGFFSLIRFALPTIIMMMFMSLYSIVDAIFVSRFVGTNALSAINIVYPVISLLMALAIMLATGGSAIVARKMGEKKEKESMQNYSLIIAAGIISGFIISFIGILFLEPICLLLGASPILLEYCKDYLFIILLFAPALTLQLLFQSFFVTAGKPALGLILTILAGVANAVLDYIFIVPLDLGIKGAAIATVIGYLIPAIVGLIYFSRKKGTLYFVRPKMDTAVLKETCLNGSSEMITNLSTAIITFLFNAIMMKFLGEDGVAAITIVLYAQFLLTALYLGFSMGVAPIISYNHGDNNADQIRQVIKNSLIFTAISSVIVYGVSLFLSEGLVKIFAAPDTAVFSIAKEGFFLFSTSFLFTGINIFASSMFTALSNGKVSAFISFMRTFVFLLLALLLLPRIMGVNGLWIAVPLSEILSFIVSLCCFRRFGERYHYA